MRPCEIMENGSLKEKTVHSVFLWKKLKKLHVGLLQKHVLSLKPSENTSKQIDTIH